MTKVFFLDGTQDLQTNVNLLHLEILPHFVEELLVTIRASLMLQIDTYGILGTIHCILFLDYMKVYKDDKGRWRVTKSFKRYVVCNFSQFTTNNIVTS